MLITSHQNISNLIKAESITYRVLRVRLTIKTFHRKAVFLMDLISQKIRYHANKNA